jgi:hypothetical protein
VRRRAAATGAALDREKMRGMMPAYSGIADCRSAKPNQKICTNGDSAGRQEEIKYAERESKSLCDLTE